ncbi:MAG: polysaccharide ABC transporter ATP-binding protein [Anaerolineae bacterium]
MTDVAIAVENLGKEYRIGTRERHDTLRDAVAGVFRRRGATGSAASGSGPSDFQTLKPSDGDTFWALHDVSFEVRRGEVVGVIGRNGAGKSTLLKILSRITEPTTGRAVIHGRVGSLLEVGTGFHPELTGRENIYLNGAILGMRRTEIDRRFDEIVAFSEIERFLDTPVKRYSSGMYVRLAFAVAAHLDPEVLIVDEVLAVGDAAFQKKCLGKMGDVAGEGRTVIFVSHNMGAVVTLCPKAMLLSRGEVQSAGPSLDVIEEYLALDGPGAALNLPDLRASGMGAKASWQTISLLTQDGFTVGLGEPLPFGLTLCSRANLKDCSVGVTIYNGMGTCIGAHITPAHFECRDGEMLSLKLTIGGLTLAPGRYYGGFSIGYGDALSVRSDVDQVVGAPVFEVVPASDSHGSIVNWSPSWGSIVITDSELEVTSL